MTRRWGRAYDAKYEALVWRQLANGMDGKTCEICMKHEDKHGKTALIIEHKDNDDDNFALENLRLAHQSCNVEKNPPNVFPRDVPFKREREKLEAPRREWSSEEGRRSEKMTYRYRQKLYHPETGIMRNPGQLFGKKALALLLPDLCEIGKSVTYSRYIEEDIAAGYLETKEIDGEEKIERTFKSYPMKLLGMSEAKPRLEASPQTQSKAQA